MGVKKLKRSEEIARQIICAIRDKKYAVGQQLPTEQQLTQIYGVGRSTIREAVKTLSADGIVVVQQGRGTFVRNTNGFHEDPLGITKLDAYDRLKQQLEARMLLEPQIALAAVRTATDGDIKKLEQLCETYNSIHGYGEDMLELDIEFHKTVARCTYNEVLVRIIPMICEAVRDSGTYMYDSKESHTKARKAHERIAHAIKNRDAISARYYMEQHIQETIQLMAKSERHTDEETNGGR